MAIFQPRFKDPKSGEIRKTHVWWFKFIWRGKLIRESTKQTNKRIAQQMEAARKAALAKGESGHTRPQANANLGQLTRSRWISSPGTRGSGAQQACRFRA